MIPIEEPKKEGLRTGAQKRKIESESGSGRRQQLKRLAKQDSSLAEDPRSLYNYYDLKDLPSSASKICRRYRGTKCDLRRRTTSYLILKVRNYVMLTISSSLYL